MVRPGRGPPEAQGRAGSVPGTPRGGPREGRVADGRLPRMAAVMGVDVSLGRGLDVALLDGSRVVQTWAGSAPKGSSTCSSSVGRRRRDRRAAAPGSGPPARRAERARLPVPPAPDAPRPPDRRVRAVAPRHRLAPDAARRGPAVLVDDGGVRGVRGGRERPATSLFLGEGSADAAARSRSSPMPPTSALAGASPAGAAGGWPGAVGPATRPASRGSPDDAPIDTAGRGLRRADRRSGSWTAPARGWATPAKARSCCRCRSSATLPPVRARPTRGAPQACTRRPAEPRLCECGCGAPVRGASFPATTPGSGPGCCREARAGAAAQASWRAWDGSDSWRRSA